jgi:formylglycine-generating enzyme
MPARSLAGAIAVLALPCGCGANADHDAIDAAAVTLDAAASPGGTWDQPWVIASLPFADTGDTRAAVETRAQHYDCAPTIDEGGAEIVYRLDLTTATIVNLALQSSTAATDVDLHVLRAPASGADARDCISRDDRAMVVDLAAGSWWIAVDTFRSATGPAAGDYTLSITVPQSTACLTNPIPACSNGDAPDVNGVAVEPIGVGGCPAGMARVANVCVDRWEAALVAIDVNGARRGWPPYRNPGSARVAAVSAPGLVPQGYINQTQASAACIAAGKRMCTDSEWLRACQGPTNTTYPYGNTREPGRCNDARTCHPAVQFFESSDSSVFGRIGDSCLDQLPDGLARTGSHDQCTSVDGIYDLMGNLHEWTADPAGTFRGGFFVDTVINGNGCLYRTTAHDVSHWDYSTGFRCCATP